MAVLGTVSDGEDTVVEVVSASVGDDTGVVSLEGELVGLDGNGDWSLSDGSLELVSGGVSGDILVGLDLTNTLGLLVHAASISGGVWVGRLGHEWGGLNVSESVVHKTTVATHVTFFGGAVN